MQTINNPAIAAIIAVIALALADAACTPNQTAALQDATAKLNVLDAQEVLETSEANEVISDLKAQLAAALSSKAALSTKPVGTVDNIQYVVNSGAYGYGSAEEISKDPAKMAAILKIEGQNILTAV